MNAESERQESHNKVKCRPHPNGEEDDGRHAGKRASGVQRKQEIAESPGTAHGAHHQLSENVWYACF